jgi:hypothetical protein
MLAPIMVFTISAARLQRPIVRTNPPFASFSSACNVDPTMRATALTKPHLANAARQGTASAVPKKRARIKGFSP